MRGPEGNPAIGALRPATVSLKRGGERQIGLNVLELITFIVAIALAAVMVIVTIRFNLQKYVIIAATAIGGAALVVGTIMLGVGGVSLLQLAESPVRLLWQASPFMAIVFVLLAAAGIVIQIQANRRFEVETYNRLAGAA